MRHKERDSGGRFFLLLLLCHHIGLLFGKRLQWLPFKFRIDFKILLTYMAINGLAPFYLQERINLNEASHVSTSYAPTVMDCY